MAEQHAIQFTYSMPPFPSPSDKIQTITLDIRWLFFLSQLNVFLITIGGNMAERNSLANAARIRPHYAFIGD